MTERTTIPTRDMTKSITGCCPPFDPSKWDKKTFVFKDKLFIKFETKSFLYVPINMNGVMTKVMTDVDREKAGNQEYLMLTRERSPWRAEHLLSVQKEVGGYESVRLDGTYLTKVFEGPYSDMRKWYSELERYVASQQKEAQQMYFDYTMCPNCAKAYKHNYVVGVAKVV